MLISFSLFQKADAPGAAGDDESKLTVSLFCVFDIPRMIPVASDAGHDHGPACIYSSLYRSVADYVSVSLLTKRSCMPLKQLLTKVFFFHHPVIWKCIISEAKY